MANSGVSVADEVQKAFYELKMGKKHRYIILKVSENRENVVVDKRSAADATFTEFVEELRGIGEKHNEGRYAVFDFELPGVEKKNKICFVTWIPDTLSIKEKMMYASTKDAVKKVMQGLQVDIHACDEDCLTENYFIEKANK